MMPVVGIPLRPWSRENRPLRVMQSAAYFSAIERAGGVPLAIPPLAGSGHLETVLSRVDALCLPGGKDVGPANYGEQPRPECHLDELTEQDAAEFPLTRAALRAGLPILGICRGLQVLNVALGGTLWQDLPAQLALTAHLGEGDDYRTTTVRHSVVTAPGSMVRAWAGGRRCEVNSRHHQAVRTLGTGLIPTAAGDDGVIEAVESQDADFVVGVQWHPEELSDAFSTTIFEALIQACRLPLSRR